MKLDTYFPWVQRVAWILKWFWRVMEAQVDPDTEYFLERYDSPELWPEWEWAAFEGCRSTESSPWFLKNGWEVCFGELF